MLKLDQKTITEFAPETALLTIMSSNDICQLRDYYNQLFSHQLTTNHHEKHNHIVAMYNERIEVIESLVSMTSKIKLLLIHDVSKAYKLG